MIFPYEIKLDTEANYIFKGKHVPNNKKDILDRILICWETELLYDPAEKTFIKTGCNCPDCQINRAKDNKEYECKHIIEDRNYLNLILR